MPWYTVENVADIPSPALLVYPDRVERNIRRMIEIAGGVERLRPHMKTNKLREVVRMHLDQGITRFKCATIAEAEMAAASGAPDVLLAYQPVGPNVKRFVHLVETFSGTQFAAVVDDEATIRALSDAAVEAGVTVDLFLDLDGGMHRTGIAPGDRALELYRLLSTLPGLRAAGLHMYDGHIHDTDLDVRQKASDEAFAHVQTMRDAIAAAGLDVPTVVVGGTPTFPLHIRRPGVECSPGTSVFWDSSYSTILPDLDFAPAVVVAHARGQPAGAESPLPGSRAQGGRVREPASAREAVRPRGRERGRPQRGAPGPRNRSRRRVPRGHGALRRAVARLPDGGAAQRGGRGPERPRRRALADRGARADADDLDARGLAARGSRLGVRGACSCRDWSPRASIAQAPEHPSREPRAREPANRDPNIRTSCNVFEIRR